MYRQSVRVNLCMVRLNVTTESLKITAPKLKSCLPNDIDIWPCTFTQCEFNGTFLRYIQLLKDE